jgi:hypothetical protein
MTDLSIQGDPEMKDLKNFFDSLDYIIFKLLLLILTLLGAAALISHLVKLIPY